VVDEAHVTAHRHSIRHYSEILRSDLCGCFYCCRLFTPSQIKDWVQDGTLEADRTALCPYCGIDSVIGSAAGYSVSEEFLQRMKNYWF